MDNKPYLIQVVLCEPGKEARIATISNTLPSLQQIVGGYIEAVYPFDDPVAIICNEEGKAYESSSDCIGNFITSDSCNVQIWTSDCDCSNCICGVYVHKTGCGI